VEFKEVGNPIKLNDSADPSGRITKKIRTYMNKVDLIPVKFELSIPPDMDIKNISEAQIHNAITYNFAGPIDDYKKNVGQYISGASFSGVRIWTTSDAQMQEDISNTFETNIIEDKMNSLITSQDSLRNAAKSLGVDMSKIASIIGSPAEDTGAQNAASTLTGMLVEGKHISLPKIWKGSNYAPSLNLNVRLVSPYGHPKSIRIHVLEPLIHLLALCSPTSPDGLTYGNVGYVRVSAYGISNINLGYIENISIVRGGSDMTFNKFSQPLFVDVNVTIRSAFDGFAMVAGENIKTSSIEGANGMTGDKASSGLTSIGSIIKSFQKRPFDESGSFSVVEKNGNTLNGLITDNLGNLIGSMGAAAVAEGIPGTIVNGVKDLGNVVKDVANQGSVAFDKSYEALNEFLN